MAKNFITNNEKQKSLKGRIRTLISISDELKFLVGFFYFSGWEEVYQQLGENMNIQLKLLVGLQVSKLVNQMVEHGEEEEDLSQEDHFHKFMSSLGQALNNGNGHGAVLQPGHLFPQNDSGKPAFDPQDRKPQSRQTLPFQAEPGAK